MKSTKITLENISCGNYIVRDLSEINKMLDDGSRLSTFMYKIGYSLESDLNYVITSMSDGWSYSKINNEAIMTREQLFKHLQNFRYATKEEVLAVIESQTRHHANLLLKGQVYLTIHQDKKGNKLYLYDISDPAPEAYNLFSEFTRMMENGIIISKDSLASLGNFIVIDDTEEDLIDLMEEKIIENNLELIKL